MLKLFCLFLIVLSTYAFIKGPFHFGAEPHNKVTIEQVKSLNV